MSSMNPDPCNCYPPGYLVHLPSRYDPGPLYGVLPLSCPHCTAMTTDGLYTENLASAPSPSFLLPPNQPPLPDWQGWFIANQDGRSYIKTKPEKKRYILL